MSERRRYDVIFEPQAEGGYSAYVPDLPGCVSEGRTIEEASEMIRDAMAGYLASLEDRGHQVPQVSVPRHRRVMSIGTLGRLLKDAGIDRNELQKLRSRAG